MTGIEAVKAREILDLRGNPTVEVDVQLSGGARAVAANMAQIKSGSASRSDRMAKCSQLLRIEEERLRRYSKEQRSFIAYGRFESNGRQRKERI